MQARKLCGPGVAFIGSVHPQRTSRAARPPRVDCSAVLLAVGLLLAGCGGRSPGMSTAPEADATVDTVNTSSAMPAATDLVGTTRLGGPLRGLDAAELARFRAGPPGSA